MLATGHFSVQGFLYRQGLTNLDSEDYGNFASGRSQEYEYFCTGLHCCRVQRPVQVMNHKTGKMERKLRWRVMDRVKKKVSTEFIRSCEDCGGLLTSKKVKQRQKRKKTGGL